MALFHYKKVKKGTQILTSPYVHSLFTIVLIKKKNWKKYVINCSAWKSDSILAWNNPWNSTFTVYIFWITLWPIPNFINQNKPLELDDTEFNAVIKKSQEMF